MTNREWLNKSSTETAASASPCGTRSCRRRSLQEIGVRLKASERWRSQSITRRARTAKLSGRHCEDEGAQQVHESTGAAPSIVASGFQGRFGVNRVEDFEDQRVTSLGWIGRDYSSRHHRAFKRALPLAASMVLAGMVAAASGSVPAAA